MPAGKNTSCDGSFSASSLTVRSAFQPTATGWKRNGRFDHRDVTGWVHDAPSRERMIATAIMQALTSSGHTDVPWLGFAF
jgi:hypothetical protein